MDNMDRPEGSPCPLELVQHIVGGKWKISILWALSNQARRFNELQKLFPAITQAMLTKQLRELEQDKFIRRKVFRQVPPRVEYSLTSLGREFFYIIEQMYEWGEKHYDLINTPTRHDK